MTDSTHEVDYQAIKERLDANRLTDEDLDAIADAAVDFLRGVLNCFDENTCSIDEYEGEDGELILNLTEGDFAVLIGRHGRCLEALQSLLTSAMNRKLGFYYPVVVDIEGYRSRRREKIIAMAHRAASRVRKNGGQVHLPAMNAYERRIAHIALRDDDALVTYSEGEDPERFVIVSLASEAPEEAFDSAIEDDEFDESDGED